MTEQEANEIANDAIRLYNAMEEILRKQNISDTAFHVLGVMAATLAASRTPKPTPPIHNSVRSLD